MIDSPPEIQQIPKYRKRIPENGIIRKLKFNQLV